jgi:hypothetical protein
MVWFRRVRERAGEVEDRRIELESIAGNPSRFVTNDEEG